MSDGGSGDGRRQTKIERVVERYDLTGLETELAVRWTAPPAERESLRDLAAYVNERILAAALAEAGVDVLPGEVENYLRLLRDDDVSAGRRTEARSSLEQAGVYVERVETDFVSHQAVHTYLTERAGVEFEGATTAERLERTRDAIARLEGRVQTVAERNIEQLAAADHLAVGDVSVLSSLDVVCGDCGERYDFDALLERGGCACGAE